MKKTIFFGLIAASVLAAGCEATPTQTAGDKAEGEVITGSRIPRKGGSDGAVQTTGQEGYKQGRVEGAK